jgi:hypothetical protein
MRGIVLSAVASTGQVVAVSTGTVTTHVAGQAYVGNDPLMVTEAVAAGDSFSGGFRYRSDGALRVVDATAGLPANSLITTEGIAQSPSGQVCYTSDAVGADSVLHGGVATTNDGRLYLSLT